MKRLNLDAFKTQANETQDLESLTGGILGACHSAVTVECTHRVAGDSLASLMVTVYLDFLFPVDCQGH